MRCFAVFLLLLCGTAEAAEWKTLQEGVSYRQLTWKASVGDGVLHVVRIDPKRATLIALASSNLDGHNRTAKEWCAEHNLAVVINAGMYATDFKTHAGYFRIGEHINSKTWVPKYKSLLALSPKKAVMLDLNKKPSGYRTLVQNLRLIEAPGKNVWSKNGRKWSEAAIAQDRHGSILFLFSRSPHTMRQFNRKLLASDLGIVRAMHAEGGPEASLSIHAGVIDLDLSGSYETGFNENDDNDHQWRLPNIIAVRKQSVRNGPTAD